MTAHPRESSVGPRAMRAAPPLMEWACLFGTELVEVHDESVSCANCMTAVCGIHAEPSAEDDELLCPSCKTAETRRLARAQ